MWRSPMFALFKDNQIISKPQSKDACAHEAYERGLTVRMPVVVETILAPGVSIRNLDPVGKP